MALDGDTANMNKRLIGILVGVAGIAALVFGLFSNRWVVGQDYGIETHVGLRSIELCQPDADCSSVTHDQIAKSPSKMDGFDTFSLIAASTFYTGLVCAALLLVIVALAGTGKYLHLPIQPTTLGIVTSFVTLMLIAVVLASHPWKAIGWGTGNAVVIAGAGAIAGLFASITLGRVMPDFDDNDWD